MSNIVEYIQRLKNVSIVNDLLSKYEYSGNNVIGYLFPYILYKKYNLKIPPKSLFCYTIKSIRITNGSDEIFQDISDYFQYSTHNKVFLKLDIDFIEKSFNHTNLLIYDRYNNTLEHYEPNGYMDEKVWGIYKNYIEKVLNILYTKLKRHNIDLKFKSSRELHDFLPSDKKMLGLQQIEGRENYNGHCQMWCFLIADLITNFPDYSTQSIIRTYLDLNNNDNLSRLNLHRKLKMIIRGFYFSSMKRLTKMDELGNLDIDLINSTDLDVISETSVLLKNIVFKNFYDEEFTPSPYEYTAASVVKSYILTVGYEKTKDVFEHPESKQIITLIYKKMKKDNLIY